jgi:hypothetical protein
VVGCCGVRREAAAERPGDDVQRDPFSLGDYGLRSGQLNHGIAPGAESQVAVLDAGRHGGPGVRGGFEAPRAPRSLPSQARSLVTHRGSPPTSTKTTGRARRWACASATSASALMKPIVCAGV